MRPLSINDRVQQLEISHGVLVKEVRDVNTKQDTFYAEWKSQQERNTRQKEEDRRTAEAAMRSNKITVPQVFAMGAALVTMLVAIGALNLYMIDNRISTAVNPLTERQNATTESNLNRTSQINDLVKTVSGLRGEFVEVARQVEANSKSVEAINPYRGRVITLEAEIKAEAEIRRLQDEANAKFQDAQAASIQQELRSFKAKMPGER